MFMQMVFSKVRPARNNIVNVSNQEVSLKRLSMLPIVQKLYVGA